MSQTSRDYSKLHVWQKAHSLTLRIYEATRSFPGDEKFGLTSQMRRSAASVPANVAEGCGRGGENGLARFLTIAQGSGSELAYHLLLARDLGLLHEEIADELIQLSYGINRMLRSYRSKLKANS